ncbi:melanin-concentrating hormone receptor 2 [Polyodon spathula]|uniref:melanin-concentrating hormone receptor 2 n=1 Tax=Polyodon spathula TaxID=7913 RepID=UPI001B7E1264|nr:melanin-concentrating hormone receptor 2 [Polyodon spathula]
MTDPEYPCWNDSHNALNSSWNSEVGYYEINNAAETIVLPCLIGIICSTGLVGNVLILVTIIRSVKKTIPDVYICNLALADLVHVIGMPFLIHQWARGGEWVFGSPLCTIITSLDTCNQFACSAIVTTMSLDRYLALVHPFRLTSLRTRSKTIQVNLCLWVASCILVIPVWVYSKVIKFKDGLESCAFDLASPQDVLWYTLYQSITSFFLPLPLILLCYILILCYTWKIYKQNKKAQRYSTTIPRDRVMRLTKMVLVLVGVFLLSAAPYHVIQLVNLQVIKPNLTYYVCYYISICLSYTSSSINPFLYILLSGNFRQRLPGCTSIRMRRTDREVRKLGQQAQPPAPVLAPPLSSIPELTPSLTVVTWNVSEPDLAMAEEDQDATSIATSWEVRFFPQDEEEGDFQELTFGTGPSSEAISDAGLSPLPSLIPVLMEQSPKFLRVPWTAAHEPCKGAGALGLAEFPPVDSTIAALMQAPAAGGLPKDPACLNHLRSSVGPGQCRVTEAHLKKDYAVEAQVTCLANKAGLLTAYLNSILQSAPLLELVASELHLVSGTLLQISGFQGQALSWSLASQVVARRQLWLSQARVPYEGKLALLDAPISPGHTFGSLVE